MAGSNSVREFEWSPQEKRIARQAFENALHRELEAVVTEVKKRAEELSEASDVWNLERYLSERRKQIDQRFDYRYTVLIFVFGNLIRVGRLSEHELRGLSADKLEAIRRFAEP